jgi:hypothetical protein
MKKYQKEGKIVNSKDIFLRRVALKTALENNMISQDLYNQEIEKINEHDAKIAKIEKQKQELLKQSRKRLYKELVTSN